MLGGKIDIHTHILPHDWPDLAAKYGGDRWVSIVRDGPCSARMMQGGSVFRQITEQCWDPLRRLRDCDADDVELQVLSTVPVMFSYWASPRAGLEMSRFLNDHLARVVEEFPQRFLGLATVPLQDADLAIKELERAVGDLRLSGVEIGSNVNGANLDDPALLPFFQRAAELDAPIFVHPWAVLGVERQPRYFFPWLVGMPAETSLAIGSLIFGGVLERLPTLRLCFAHGGGSFPFLLGRWERGHAVAPACREAVPKPPREYAARLYFDSLVHEPRALRLLIDLFGSERLIIGSDYPFALGEDHPGAILDRLPRLGATDRANISRDSARRFLKLA